MRVLAAAEAMRGAHPPRALAIGNFDGVHRGHQELVRVARERAAATGATAGVLTFTPHPARVFAPALAPPLIVSLERRLELLGLAGADVAIVEEFTPALAAVEAEAFVRDILVRGLGARQVVVGWDFSFGRGRRGNPALLRDAGAALGLGVTVVPPVTVDGLVCSSTKVREFVLEGRVEGAALLLGRPAELQGVVVRGAGRGRGLGIPTANVTPEAELVPKVGIYAARAHVLDAAGAIASTHKAALSIGSNPTFVAAGAVTIEAHLLDFDADLYEKRLRIEVLHRLRDERRFDSVEALLAQIAVDVAETRARVS
ncbi:MAG TPA: bifunctional riboflavin kinase/FAD synthetase [Polyangia bacterium]|nr:bifunctional riboflavin kinase/FAD synthetase [Polyangia bacterium]